MAWNIPLFRYLGASWDAKGRYRRRYGCNLCGQEVNSSQRSAHGKRHTKKGEAVPQAKPFWNPRQRQEWEIQTDDPAHETEFRRVPIVSRRALGVAEVLAAAKEV